MARAPVSHRHTSSSRTTASKRGAGCRAAREVPAGQRVAVRQARPSEQFSLAVYDARNIDR